MLEIDNICKSFSPPGAARIEVLKDISFSMNSGETRAVIGHSGSGKTTLLSLMAGLDVPDRGRVILDGENISAMSEDRLARFRAGKIGIVFQQFHLMPHLTARENIGLPLEILKKGRVRERTRDMVEKVGLADRQNHLPGQLSGGECQRVAIARALVTNPSLVLADEPTGNLDTLTGERVADLMFELVEQEGKSLVLVTHNWALADRCHQILRLEQGRLN